MAPAQLGYSSCSSDKNIIRNCNSSRQEFRNLFIQNSLHSSLANIRLFLGHTRRYASSSAMGYLHRCADCLFFAIYRVRYGGYAIAINHWYCNRRSINWYTLCSVHGLALQATWDKQGARYISTHYCKRVLELLNADCHADSDGFRLNHDPHEHMGVCSDFHPEVIKRLFFLICKRICRQRKT